MKSKIKIGIVGASEYMGQKMVEVLQNHPYMEIHSLHGSGSSVGKTLAQVYPTVCAQLERSTSFQKQIVSLADIDMNQIDLFYSAVPGAISKKLESELAIQKPVISLGRQNSVRSDVPLLHPAINPHHVELLDSQRKNNRWRGFICCSPHPSLVGPAAVLYPVFREFGLSSVITTLMEPISASGNPGVSSYNSLGNIIPNYMHIQDQFSSQLKRIFGVVEENTVTCPDFDVDARIYRVPVLRGYQTDIVFKTVGNTTLDELINVLNTYSESLNINKGNSTPDQLFRIFGEDEPHRPQPNTDLPSLFPLSNMQIQIGGLKVLSRGKYFRCTVLSDDVGIGSAAAAIWTAEMLNDNNLI